MEHHGPSLEHPTWLHFLYAKHILPEWLPEMVPVTWLVILILSVIVIIASRRLSVRNPGRFQTALEFIVTALDGFVRNIVGQEAKTLTPIIGTVFIFILSLSLFGLIPGFMSPTSNPNTTIALALMAFILVQYFAISRQGLKNYLKHFVGEPVWLGPLMVPLHIIGELAKPLSLSIRLFGNIFGEETVIAVFIIIVTQVIKVGDFVIPVPLQFPMMLFAIFGSFIQALVFSMLVSIYIAVGISAHEEHH